MRQWHLLTLLCLQMTTPLPPGCVVTMRMAYICDTGIARRWDCVTLCTHNHAKSVPPFHTILLRAITNLAGFRSVRAIR